jgi:hypothetical protein
MMNNGFNRYNRGRIFSTHLLYIALFIFVIALAGPGCNSAATTASSAQFVATNVYCGRNIPAGGEVTEEQFAAFLETDVTPAFPAGLTAYDAYGQMQTAEGKIVKQKTKVLLLVHDNSKTSVDAIHKIVASYRSKFGNPQVMVMTAPVAPEFYGN